MSILVAECRWIWESQTEMLHLSWVAWSYHTTRMYSHQRSTPSSKSLLLWPKLGWAVHKRTFLRHCSEHAKWSHFSIIFDWNYYEYFWYVTVHILRSISCIHGHKNFIIEKYFEIFLDGYIIMRELRLTFEQMLSRSEKIRTVTS